VYDDDLIVLDTEEKCEEHFARLEALEGDDLRHAAEVEAAAHVRIFELTKKEFLQEMQGKLSAQDVKTLSALSEEEYQQMMAAQGSADDDDDDEEEDDDDDDDDDEDEDEDEGGEDDDDATTRYRKPVEADDESLSVEDSRAWEEEYYSKDELKNELIADAYEKEMAEKAEESIEDLEDYSNIEDYSEYGGYTPPCIPNSEPQSPTPSPFTLHPSPFTLNPKP